MTLVGFLRGDTMNVYTGEHRVALGLITTPSGARSNGAASGGRAPGGADGPETFGARHWSSTSSIRRAIEHAG